MGNLIDVRGFRKLNHITQSDLADFLGTSIAFISQVENGQHRMPKDKMIKILREGYLQKGWEVYSLVPAYGRIMRLHNHLKKEKKEYLTTDEHPLMLSDIIMRSIIMGEMGITDEVARAIIDHLKHYNIKVNEAWLKSGEGEMLVVQNNEESLDDLRIRFTALEKKYDSLLKRVRALESKA